MTAHETIVGFLTTNAPVPPGIDPGRLVVWEQRMGFSYQQLRGTIGAAIQEADVEWTSNWGGLCYLTPEQSVWYPNGGDVVEFDQLAGGARPNPVKGGQAGHMIPMVPWGKAIGGDWRTLADMPMGVILSTTKGIIAAARDLRDRQILIRFFDPTENTIGTVGADVPFCNGSPNSGSGGPKYAPLKWGGFTFDYTHSHYLLVNNTQIDPRTAHFTPTNFSSPTFGTMLESLAFLIAEHGIGGQLCAIMSEGDTPLLDGLENYVTPVSTIPWMDRGGMTTGSIYAEQTDFEPIKASGNRFVGHYRSQYGLIGLYANNRVPLHYVGMFRPGSVLNPSNAVAIRYRPEWGFGLKVLDIPNEETTFPIKEIDIDIEFGVSCGQTREAGAAGYFDGTNGLSSYPIPAIS